MKRRTPWKTFEVIPPENVIGKWVRYYSWKDNVRFKVKKIDLISQKVRGDYYTDLNEVKNTQFNLCRGFSVEPRNHYWYIIEDPDDVRFTLDDGLFEV